MIDHHLKTWPEPFDAVWDGRKTAEFRFCGDREFREGQVVCLEDWRPDHQGYSPPCGYTGAKVIILITDLRVGGLFGIPADHCMFSFAVLFRVTPEGEVVLPPRPSISKRSTKVFESIARDVLREGD